MHGLHRGAHARAGRKAVVYKDNRIARQVQGGPAATVGFFPTPQLLALPCRRFVERVLRDAHRMHDARVHNLPAAARDGAHGQLLVARNTHFAHE